MSDLCAKCQLPESNEIHSGGFLGGKHPFSVDRVCQEIKDLIRRGNVTPAELSELRCNSWEWEALVPAMTDEAFIDRMEHTLKNCSQSRERPYTTYDQALQGLWAPELLKRFEHHRANLIAAEGTYQEILGILRSLLPLLPENVKQSIQMLINEG
jgi:hypothetical protein